MSSEGMSSIENFKCPVCFEIPSGNVFQCHNGHTVCDQCERQLNKCPLCKVRYGNEKIRNLYVEQLLDTMKFPCPNLNEGCSEVLERKMVQRHHNICKFTVKSINLCKKIGHDCPCQVRSNEHIDSFVTHLQTSHQALVHNQGPDLQLTLEYQPDPPSKFLKNENMANLIWKPVVIQFEQINFLILSYVNGTEKSVTWVCLLLEHHPEAEVKYRMELSISGRNQRQDLEWLQNCVNYVDAEMPLSAKPVQVSLSLLKEEKYMDEGRFNVTFRIIKDSRMMTSPEEVTSVVNLGSSVPVEFEEANEGDEGNSVNDEVHGYIFEGFACDICSKCPVEDVLFWCLQCADFGVCNECFSSSIHAFHVFAVVRSEHQYSVMLNLAFAKRHRGPILSRLAALRGSRKFKLKPILATGDDFDAYPVYMWIKEKNQAVFESVECDRCKVIPIVGVRFKCLQCENYDLCERCLDTSPHFFGHVFAIITNPFQNEFITEEARKKSPILHIPDDASRYFEV